MASRRSSIGVLGAVAAASALAACGSTPTADLPLATGPPAAPPTTVRPAGRVVAVGSRAARDAPAPPAPRSSTLDRGRVRAVLDPRARVLEFRSVRTGRALGSAPVGVGPTHVACLVDGPCFVTDTTGGALLIVSHGIPDPGRSTSQPRVVRRLDLPGGPYGLALDPRRRRLVVALAARSVVAVLPSAAKPRVVRTIPALRGARTVAVDPRTGHLAVTGSSARDLQLVAP